MYGSPYTAFTVKAVSLAQRTVTGRYSPAPVEGKGSHRPWILPSKSVRRATRIGASRARPHFRIEPGNDGANAGVWHWVEAVTLQRQLIPHMGGDAELDVELPGGIGVGIE